MKYIHHRASANGNLEDQVLRFIAVLKATDFPGSTYEPFIPAVRSRSRGYLQRVPGDGCIYDFLSRPEFYSFLPFDHEREAYPVIRPQFRILPELTRAVSRAMKLYNPYSERYPATVDFIVSKRTGGWIAVDFKKAKDLKDSKVQSKLRLVTEALSLVPDMERRILTDDNLNPQTTRNLRFIRLYALPYDPPPATDEQRTALEPVLFALLQNGKATIYDAAKEAAAVIAVTPACAVKSCLWFIANRIWSADLQQPIGPDYPIINLSHP